MQTLLKNGTVIDGAGVPRRTASLLIRDGRIADLDVREPLPEIPAIDCSGLVIAPGFVDVHTHSDLEVLRGCTNKILQGVTTEIVGNCSYSLFPRGPDRAALEPDSIFEDQPPLPIHTATDYFDALEAVHPLVNVASLTGHSALRSQVMRMSAKAPSHTEQHDMERLLDQTLGEGSPGFSTGLNCLPSSFGGFDELAGLCRVLKPRGAWYTTHMRDYKFHVVEAVQEAIDLAKAADVPVQLSHVQVVGRKSWRHLDTILNLVDEASARGVDIGMDAYPYLAGSCSLVQFLPQWCQDGGIPALLGHLDSPAQRDRIARETEDDLSNSWADIVICAAGKSIEQIAAERGTAPRDTALDLLREQAGRVFVISFNSCEDNLRRVLTHRLTSVCSDSFIAPDLSHPRTFGTYPLFLGRYVRELGWLPLEDAVAKASAQPARRFGMQGRGTIERGNWADLVIFDPETIGTEAGYGAPDQPPMGIHRVLVNGEVVVEDGKLTGKRPGVPLRRIRPSVLGG